MKSATHTASVALMLALAFSLAGTSALRGQDAAPASSSVVPRLIKFNGVIASPGTQNRTSNGASAALVTATFSLYALQEGGSPLWSESQSVQLDEQGRYGVVLGAASPGGLPLDLFTSGEALWLGVQPQLPGAGELPRVLLAAVPYALKASDSETLGGKPASAYALAGAPTMVEVAGAAPSAASTTTTSTGSQVNAAASSASSPQAATPCTALTSDGTATANTVAKFTSACNIQNSLIRDTGTGVAVGGTATPGALLDVQFTSTAATGALLGQRVLTTLNPTATSTASTNGLFSNVQTASGNVRSFFGNLYALNSELDHYGTGKLTSGFGINSTVANLATGTITNAYGIYTSLSNASTGTLTNGYGVYVNSPSNTGTFSNFTGLYIASPTAVVPGAYGVYSAGGTNYFNGNVGIGTNIPSANLEVNGTTRFDGLVTFKSGQTFPGAGTVTSVVTGAGLTGGPITKNGTLSIATAGVKDGMLAIAYSGVGACAAGKVVSALTRSAAPTCTTAGAGTVTSVGSGSGLTGGPITSTGTLSIATAGVTDAMLANPYSGVGTCASGKVVSALTRAAAPTCITAGTGTVTSVGSGSGLTGGPITGTGTLSIATAGVTDAMLASPYSGVGTCGAGMVVTALARNGAPTCAAASAGTVTSITAGTGLSGGIITTSGTINNTGVLGVGVTSGITTTGGQTPILGIDPTVVPELNANNTFNGYDTFMGGYGWFQNGLYAEPFLDAYGAGNGTALFGYNDSTDSTHPTLYLENDDATSAGDLVFDAVGPSFGGQCTIDVSGNLFCTGTLGFAAKKASDNRQVGLYTLQSSENWIEDFGSGALVNGVATINIDPQFAQTVTADASYHVFLTPNGDCEGLYVTQKGPDAFEVHELKGGKSNVQFDYRIVAHRKGFETARLPDLTAMFQKKVQPPARPKAAVERQH
ncbi:MAG TPA: hypothetical protein VKO18_06950 [Terriglobia bacterium]|nr:hypothetical protein [Terriglobia bacterium]